MHMPSNAALMVCFWRRRRTGSSTAENMIQKPKVKPINPTQWKAPNTSPWIATANAADTASNHQSGLAVTVSLPRRRAECIPTPKNTIKGSMGTKNITANTGGPTEILPMPSSSYTNGDRVPQSTSPATLTRITLFTSRKNSREKSSKPPATYSFGARHAYRVSDPPIVKTRTPERTRKVPTRLKEKAKIASNKVQLLKMPRFSVTLSEWINAVPTSQGMNEAFSTGSQNHHPPQPSS